MLIMLNQSGIVAYSNERQLQVVSDFHLTQLNSRRSSSPTLSIILVENEESFQLATTLT